MRNRGLRFFGEGKSVKAYFTLCARNRTVQVTAANPRAAPDANRTIVRSSPVSF